MGRRQRKQRSLGQAVPEMAAPSVPTAHEGLIPVSMLRIGDVVGSAGNRVWVCLASVVTEQGTCKVTQGRNYEEGHPDVSVREYLNPHAQVHVTREPELLEAA